MEVRLIRLRHWLIPADDESYHTLRDLGIVNTRITVDVFATIRKLVLNARNVRVKVTEFQPILASFADKAATAWKKIPNSRFTYRSNGWTFETLHSGVGDRARIAVPKLKERLEAFFERWGSDYEFVDSESRGNVRLHVRLKHGAKSPIIGTSPTSDTEQDMVIRLGNVELTIQPDNRGGTASKHLKRLTIRLLAGNDKTILHTSYFLDSKVGVEPKALGYLINKLAENS